MPYVRETHDLTTNAVEFVRSNGSVYATTVPLGWHLEQFGYRSGRLSDEVRASLDGSRGNTWKDSLRVIQGLDYEYNTRAHRQASVVNLRDFSREESRMIIGAWSTTATNPLTHVTYSDTGTQGLRLTTTVPNSGPTWVSESDAAKVASKLMRESVPTSPSVDLFRSLGELRDFPRMFHMSNYMPSGAKQNASAYLNLVFGIKPTLKDLGAFILAVNGSVAIMQRYLDHQNRALRRTRTDQHARIAFSQEVTHTGTGTNQTVLRDGPTNTWGSVYSYAPASGTRSSGSRGSVFTINVSVEAVTTIKSFATFEYFIPRPTGFADRLDLYRRKLEQVLGSGLTPSVVYDLTGWSWLLDWAVDLGGLLRYQQTVADNNVVASRSGWVSETTVTISAAHVPRYSVGFDTIKGALALQSTGKFYRRRAGGPYQILQPWSLSENQAAIVTALGISRYSPV